jgi:hypothetical protein
MRRAKCVEKSVSKWYHNHGLRSWFPFPPWTKKLNYLVDEMIL